MFMFGVFLILISIPASARGARCLPKQWQGIELVSHQVNGSITKIYTNVSFDASLKMIASDSYYLDNSGQKIHEYALQDFSTGTEYDVVGGKCKTQKMTSGFPWCLPASATVLLKSYVGFGDTKIATTTFQVSDNPETGSGIVTVTDESNTPVNFQLSSIMDSLPVEVYGLTLGIKDPSVFKVPGICSK